MLSVSGKNWEEIKISSRILDKLKNEKNFSEIVSKIIISNNFDDLEINTLKEKISLQNPFYKTNDFIEATNIFNNSLNNNEIISETLVTHKSLNFKKVIKKVNFINE